MAHEGRLYCAPCLKAVAADASGPVRGSIWPKMRRGVSTVLAVVVAWWVFYAVSAVAVRVPSAIHDGSIWGGQLSKGGDS